jgi:toxin ParE1/3/4
VSRYLLSPAAQSDLGQIWDYTRERAAANPRIGRACDEIRPGYRKLAAGSHILFYRVSAGGIIDVGRVLHERMDVDRHL